MNIEGQSSVQRIYAVTSINNKKRSMRAVNNAASLLRKVSHFAHSHPQSVTHKPQSFLALTCDDRGRVHCHSLTHSLTHSQSLTVTHSHSHSQATGRPVATVVVVVVVVAVRSFELRTSNFELRTSEIQLPTSNFRTDFFLLSSRSTRREEDDVCMYVCCSFSRYLKCDRCNGGMQACMNVCVGCVRVFMSKRTVLCGGNRRTTAR